MSSENKENRGAKRPHSTIKENDVDLKSQLIKVRKAIRGQIGRRLRKKTSKMRFDVPMVSLESYAALCRKDMEDLPNKKGAYYPMEEVMPPILLPGVFDPTLPEKKRLWYAAIDPEHGFCKTTYGHPKSLCTYKACELRYKPSSLTLSVTCWSEEIRSWEACCQGRGSLSFRD